MPHDRITGAGEPSSMPLVPLKGTEATSQTGFLITGAATKDQVQRSEELPLQEILCQCDKPALQKPDQQKVDQALPTVVKFLHDNPWFKPSFLTSFTEVIYELLKMQKTAHYNEAQTELTVRGQLYDLAFKNASLQKQITENQAFEKFVQAFASLATVAVTTINLVESTKNFGEASKKVEEQIKTADKELMQAKIKENPATKTIDIDPKLPPQKKAAEFKKLEDIINQDKTTEYKTDAVKNAEKTLHSLKENREYNISNKERMMSQISSMRGEAFKSTVQAAAQFATGSITLGRSTLEEVKGQVDAVMQSFNKFSETSSKSRDEAKQMFDRFADFLARIIESVHKTHSITGRM